MPQFSLGQRLERLKFKKDYRGRLPVVISRFLGYRPPEASAPFDPLPFPPFIWLHKIPIKYELWLFAWVGAFGGILLIEAIMSTSTAFRDIYHTPTIVTSFGASAVLLFGAIEAPLAQPRNFVLGHFVSSLIGTAITRLFVLNRQYQGYLDNSEFHVSTFINGGLSMATSLLGQLVIGAVHPP
jgi:CBS-domain-containing membrane protein